MEFVRYVHVHVFVTYIPVNIIEYSDIEIQFFHWFITCFKQLLQFGCSFIDTVPPCVLICKFVIVSTSKAVAVFDTEPLKLIMMI